jgi:hypothetical protein
MKIEEQELFEAELRQLRPAKPPQKLTERLAAIGGRQEPAVQSRRTKSPGTAFRRWGGFPLWLVPAGCALLLTAGLGWWLLHPAGDKRAERPASQPTPGWKADSVEIDRELVASFDAIANLPGGEPVRLRCSEWEERVSFHDRARGLVVERRTPRLEVVPVRFETD